MYEDEEDRREHMALAQLDEDSDFEADVELDAEDAEDARRHAPAAVTQERYEDNGVPAEYGGAPVFMQLRNGAFAFCPSSRKSRRRHTGRGQRPVREVNFCQS